MYIQKACQHKLEIGRKRHSDEYFLLGVISLVFAILAWASPRQPPEKPPSPLEKKTAAQLLNTYIPQEYQIDWVDRQSPDLADLRQRVWLSCLSPSSPH